MTIDKKTSLNPLNQGNYTTCLIADGKILVPIPIEFLNQSGLNPNMPIAISNAIPGTLIIFNPDVINPEVLKQIIPPLKM